MTHVHHSALCTSDLAESLRFYRDGLGLSVLMDHEFDGGWRTLFDARSDRLHSVFLGDPQRPDAGIVELVVFDGGMEPGPADGPPAIGFFLLSMYVDVEATLARLAALGLGGTPRRIEAPAPQGPVAMATVRDPDGVLVELIDAASAAR
ncbi:MAG: VOC family protein [Actinobacteria bacterium]|nr:VOC family protein [Actinomycetota bacterium]